jgi:hypothetical protein
MPVKNKEKDNRSLFEILSQHGSRSSEKLLPVSLYKALEIDEENKNFPNDAISDFHKDEKYWCVVRAKPISQVSNLY